MIERATGAPKVSPAPLKDTLLGASLGFVVALLIAGAREAFNTRIRSESDVQDALGKPVLATIQTLPKRAGLVTIGRHETRWGDTYGLLAANLMQLRGPGPTILAVTSAIAGEGKTTTASNLAVALALRGQRVVLAEFDIRKPAVSKLFRIPPDSPGIIQVVDGTTDLESALWTVELNGNRPGGVSVLPPSATPVNGDHPESGGSLRIVPSGGFERGARVARATQTRQLIEDLGHHADVVVLDTPPALATVEMAELSTARRRGPRRRAARPGHPPEPRDPQQAGGGLAGADHRRGADRLARRRGRVLLLQGLGGHEGLPSRAAASRPAGDRRGRRSSPSAPRSSPCGSAAPSASASC